jgi:hypothetical protein
MPIVAEKWMFAPVRPFTMSVNVFVVGQVQAGGLRFDDYFS